MERLLLRTSPIPNSLMLIRQTLLLSMRLLRRYSRYYNHPPKNVCGSHFTLDFSSIEVEVSRGERKPKDAPQFRFIGGEAVSFHYLDGSSFTREWIGYSFAYLSSSSSDRSTICTAMPDVSNEIRLAFLNQPDSPVMARYLINARTTSKEQRYIPRF